MFMNAGQILLILKSLPLWVRVILSLSTCFTLYFNGFLHGLPVGARIIPPHLIIPSVSFYFASALAFSIMIATALIAMSLLLIFFTYVMFLLFGKEVKLSADSDFGRLFYFPAGVTGAYVFALFIYTQFSYSYTWWEFAIGLGPTVIFGVLAILLFFMRRRIGEKNVASAIPYIIAAAFLTASYAMGFAGGQNPLHRMGYIQFQDEDGSVTNAQIAFVTEIGVVLQPYTEQNIVFVPLSEVDRIFMSFR